MTDSAPGGVPALAPPLPVLPDFVPKIAKYTVLSKLASGGMADIFVAQRDGSDEICVIKQLHEHLAKDRVVANRFLREAQVAFLLDHKNVARILDADFANANVYLAMEFIAGQDVESMMFKLMEQQKMLPPALSVTATLQVLEGLHHAHEKRGPDGTHLEIVHRDLSPRNVMVTYTGDVKVIDFGLARTNLGEFRTAPGMVLGTLRYMSPEQAVADPVDRRSDIYTWAVVLYEMLSGRPLVLGANAQEVLNTVVTFVPKPLSTLNPAMPQALDEVLARGMAKNRSERYATAEEFRVALAHAAGELGQATPEQVGAFVAELFPDEYRKTLELMENARRGEYFTCEPTRYETPQDVQMTQRIVRALGDGPVSPATLPDPAAALLKTTSVVQTLSQVRRIPARSNLGTWSASHHPTVRSGPLLLEELQGLANEVAAQGESAGRDPSRTLPAAGAAALARSGAPPPSGAVPLARLVPASKTAPAGAGRPISSRSLIEAAASQVNVPTVLATRPASQAGARPSSRSTWTVGLVCFFAGVVCMAAVSYWHEMSDARGTVEAPQPRATRQPSLPTAEPRSAMREVGADEGAAANRARPGSPPGPHKPAPATTRPQELPAGRPAMKDDAASAPAAPAARPQGDEHLASLLKRAEKGWRDEKRDEDAEKEARDLCIARGTHPDDPFSKACAMVRLDSWVAAAQQVPAR